MKLGRIELDFIFKIILEVGLAEVVELGGKSDNKFESQVRATLRVEWKVLDV